MALRAARVLDQIVIFGEAHLRRILSAYAAYYTIEHARTWPYKRMRHCGEPSTESAALSLYPFWPGYTINMSGYDFRKGQSMISRL